MLPFGVAEDGKSIFAAIHTRAFAGVAEVDVGSGRYRKIKRFANRSTDQASGDFDGRWLVWTERHSLYNVADFSIWSWDSRTGRLRHLADSRSAPGGDPWPSAWESAHVFDGFATWEQGVGPNRGEVHVVDLRTGSDLVVSRGLVGSSIVVSGPLVLWPQTRKRGVSTSPRAAYADTGRRAGVPAAFWHSHGLPATDGRAVVEADGAWRELWYSPSLRQETHRVLRTPEASDHVDNSLQVDGRYVAFGTDDPSLNLADAKAGRYVRVSKTLGWIVLSSKALALVKPAVRPRKVSHPILRVVVLPLSEAPPIPACAKVTKAGAAEKKRKDAGDDDDGLPDSAQLPPAGGF